MGVAPSHDLHRTLPSLRFGQKSNLCLIPLTEHFFPDANCLPFQQLYECRTNPRVAFNYLNHEPNGGLPLTPLFAGTAQEYRDRCMGYNRAICLQTKEELLEAVSRDRRYLRPLSCAIGLVSTNAEFKGAAFHLPPDGTEEGDDKIKKVRVVGYFGVQQDEPSDLDDDLEMGYYLDPPHNLGEDIVFKVLTLAMLSFQRDCQLLGFDDVTLFQRVVLRFLPTYTHVLACVAHSLPRFMSHVKGFAETFLSRFVYEEAIYRVALTTTVDDVRTLVAAAAQGFVRTRAEGKADIPPVVDTTNPLRRLYDALMAETHNMNAPLDNKNWILLSSSMSVWQLRDSTLETMAALLGTKPGSVHNTALVVRKPEPEAEAIALQPWIEGLGLRSLPPVVTVHSVLAQMEREAGEQGAAHKDRASRFAYTVVPHNIDKCHATFITRSICPAMDAPVTLHGTRIHNFYWKFK